MVAASAEWCATPAGCAVDPKSTVQGEEQKSLHGQTPQSTSSPDPPGEIPRISSLFMVQTEQRKSMG